MSKDRYRLTGRLLGLLEPLNAPLRDIAVRMTAPTPRLRVLDAGCGAGALLARYQAAGCAVSGVDLSPSMVGRARRRLGATADIRVADAAALPFDTGAFDLVTVMLVLHEMPPEGRDPALLEMRRVLAEDGRLLVVDFNPGPVHGARGRALRGLSVAAELLARHHDRFRWFIAAGGAAALAKPHFRVARSRTVGGGNVGLYVLEPAPGPLTDTPTATGPTAVASAV